MSRPINSNHSAEPWQRPAPTCSWLMMSASAKRLRPGWSSRRLLLRHRARTVIIVCPPSLALKWQDEMREKFGLGFTIINSERMADVRRSHGLAANPFRLFPRVIVSMAWLSSSRAQRLLRDVYRGVERRHHAKRYAFDILVVDEAHHVAPSSPSNISGARGYAVDSQRTLATRALAERCEHRLFLSATPHNGHSESFTALLEMIDGRRFTRGAALDESALKEITVRRLKADIADKDFKTRRIVPLPFTPATSEADTFADVAGALADSAKANGRRSTGDIVALLLKKRFLSSPWAFALTLSRYDRAVASGGLPEDDDYYAEILGGDQSDEEEGLPEQPESVALHQSKHSDPLVSASAAQIDKWIAWGMGFEHKPDSRMLALLDFLDAVCRIDGCGWSNERVVLFTEYAATLNWIVGILQQRGYADVLGVIQGSTPAEDRELIRARFSEDPARDPIRVLVATDAAGEGIDLQAHCHRLVNIDIPFNPSRLEQRIGRIDRYGQRHAPQVYYLVPNERASTYAADLDFMRRIAEKVITVKEDLGSVNPLIDAEIQQHFSPTSARPARQPKASDGAKIINGVLAGGLTLNRELTELSRDFARRQEAMHLTPFSSHRVVDTALRLAAQPPLTPVADVDSDAQVWAVPSLGPRWHDAVEGLDTRLQPGVTRPITFDAEAARDRTDLVHVHLGHPLMNKAARLLRSSIFGSAATVHRVTAVVDDTIPTSCVAAVSRLVLVGRGGLRLHEEVFLTGIRLHGNAMAEQRVDELLDAVLDAPELTQAEPEVRAALAHLWSAEESRMRRRLDESMRRRAEVKHAAVEERLTHRRDGDLQRAEGIFAAFRVNLRDSLAQIEREQDEQASMLPLPDDQRRQRQRDIAAMQDRLADLDDEEARELAGIRERYADVRPFVSAAAVVFALTPTDAARLESGR